GARRLPVGRAAGKEIGQCDRHRLHIALVEIKAEHRSGWLHAKRRNSANPSRSAEQYVATARQRHVALFFAVRIVLEVGSARSIVHGEITLKVANLFRILPRYPLPTLRVGAHQPRNMSLGSKLTSTSCHASYFEAGRRNGWQRRTALVAASAA